MFNCDELIEFVGETLLANKKMREIEQLFQDLNGIYQNLRELNVIRTKSIVSEIAEYRASKHYNLKRAAVGQRGYDMTDNNGVRYQVKCNRGNARLIGGLNNTDYDVLIVVILKEDFTIKTIFTVKREKIQ